MRANQQAKLNVIHPVQLRDTGLISQHTTDATSLELRLNVARKDALRCMAS